MRVFDTYSFNIADKAQFKDARPYLENMLAECGYSYQKIGFALGCHNTDTVRKIEEKFPALKKYYYFQRDRGWDRRTFSSFSENWRDGDLYAEPQDWQDIFDLISKIPRPYRMTGDLILDGVNWFEDSDPAVMINYAHGNNDQYPVGIPFYSNRVKLSREYDDGLKRTNVSICIDVTDGAGIRSSKPVIDRLIPFLGEPYYQARTCLVPKEELEARKEKLKVHRPALEQLARDMLPPSILEQQAANLKPYDGYGGNLVLHVADKITMNKAFKGTGFEREKGGPSWLQTYSCKDQHGYLYEACAQKLTYSNRFRIWLTISGYNFGVSLPGSVGNDYAVPEEGQSLEILRQFAALCVKVREEYAEKLYRDFGDTPEWYYQ